MSLFSHSIAFRLTHGTVSGLGALALAAALAGCNTDGAGSGLSSTLGGLGGSSGSSSTENKVGAVADMFKAVSVSDDEVKSMSLQMREAEDKKYTAKAGGKYAKRLARLTRKHVNEDGLTLNFKVYAAKSINANATPDGSIRVYTGLMDMMTDQELLGVIGHEIGHVKLGHAMSSVRTAYLASAGRKAAASSSGAGGVLAASELGALTEAVVKSQFSQSQETASDDYGLAFMKKHGYDASAMESAFRKLASLGGKSGGALESILSTHPDPGKRADRIHEMIGE
ncbi:MAG: M48 family metalloprotease [Burkholderiaceae bacterium]|nr:M48 family metalloprotease [Burkholderiaceae bacterium]